MDHEKCYVFSHERPAKRRRVDIGNEGSGLDASLPMRRRLYHELWQDQQRRIEEVIKAANEAILDEISSFVADSRSDGDDLGTLRAGFILAGPSIAAHSFIFGQIQERTLDQHTSVFIPIASHDSANLKTVLKAIVKIGTARNSVDDDDLELLPQKRSERKLLDYDLQLLHERVEENGVRHVVVAFRDCEAFDSGVLSEAIELLALWSNRIPFVLLFGIATSVDNLQERLSQNATRCLVGQQFDAVQPEQIVEDVFATTTVTGSHRLWLGAQIGNMLLQRHHENLLSTQDLVDSLQYAYMSHFYANPLSVFLSRDLSLDDISKEHIEAVRNTTSFRKFAEASLTSVESARSLQRMLESDDALLKRLTDAVQELESALTFMAQTVQTACAINSELSKTKLTSSSLYLKAMSGKLRDDHTIRELLLAVKKAPSNILIKALRAAQAAISANYAANIENLLGQLNALASEDGSGQPMRSEHDIRNDTLRTTVVAQKVQLSRHKARLSEKDEAYSKIVSQFHDLLTRIFEEVRYPFDMLGHEAVIYDLRMPHRAALTPKPRFAIERALSSPHDYLNCRCCGPAENGGKNGEEAILSASLPPTALLYRLYLESGALINVSDLWSAYAAIMEGEGESDTSKLMPLFQRAVAELKYLGFVKPTRKKMDHITKVAWKGL
ncbi:hypothetical protein, variant [Verruconis gallopava]|uniref:Uncharacterized protein n=1 Tax=Verruconis gallopava TaxID=253628 RepID=A0A0D2ABG2_9PEZI|nr:uncharacterized protein PV09_04956 [Verruconis gallopava]XP_016214018.1 hypothetical protein, variant [Verruconis gallopava]KIW04148.1 hypothetical protein PV09_04956 [Verruconis gallopava]KIW04149.1 hypothetical protein, variant [Verruconis gallopava]